MTEIKTIKNLEKFRNTIEYLYKEIQREQKRREKDYYKIDINPPSRISIQELDLSNFKEEMLSVHKTLQWRKYNYRLSIQDARRARYVAIAGICELIKDEYIGKFWDLFIRVFGWDKDKTVYDWIWEKGFRELGIEMIGDERREFVQTLVMESGVPKNRAADIVNFFEIYWRYLRGRNVNEIIIDLNSDIKFSNIPKDDRKRLLSMAQTASEFTKAFAVAVSRLSMVFEYITDSDEIFGGDIDDWNEKVFKGTGIQPLTIIRGGDHLKRLYNKILGIVTPEKLSRIMAAKPPGTKVATPDGKMKRVDNYDDIMLGRHIVDGAVFTCLPSPELDFSYIKSLNANELTYHGDAVIIRSESQIIPIVNETIRKDLSRELYVNQRHCGNVFYIKPKPAMEICIKSLDGKLDEAISGRDGFVCYPYLYYKRNFKNNSHFLYVRVNFIKLFSNALKEREYSFQCNFENDSLHSGRTDKFGRAGCAERSVLIEHPVPGNIIFSAVDSITGDVLKLANSAAKVELTIPDIMLFSPYSHYQIKPRKSISPYLFGSRRFVMFVTSSALKNSIELENFDIESKSNIGQFNILNLVWRDQSKQSQIIAKEKNEEIIKWSFLKCINFNLYLNRTKNTSPKFVNFKDYQGAAPGDFELVIHPIPDLDVRDKLFLNIVVNDSKPKKVPISNYCQKFIEDKSVRINGVEFEHMLKPLWQKNHKSNAIIEVALCAPDETLADRKIVVFPFISVKIPSWVRDGDTFPAKVEFEGGVIIKEVLLKNPRGRSKVRVLIDHDDGAWCMRAQTFRAKVEIEQLETSLDIEACPPIHAVRFGNRDKRKAEASREILRRELGPYDLLVVTDKNDPPNITINQKRYNIPFTHANNGLWYIALSQLPGIINKKNEVIVRYKRYERKLLIRYRVALIDIEVPKYMIKNTLIGNCSFRGPIHSKIKLRLVSIRKNGLASEPKCALLQPHGMEINNQSFEIKYPVRDNSDEIEHYELSAMLKDESRADAEGYEYGERWVILPESSVQEYDYEYLKERIVKLIANEKPFAAAKHLNVAKTLVPEYELEWLKNTEKQNRLSIAQLSINRVAIRLSEVLRKEYLFEVLNQR